MRAFSKLAVFLAWTLTFCLGTAAVGQGQLTPVITVNDRVITQFELNQRKLLLELFRTPGDLDELARSGLIEDRLKQQELDRFGIALSDEALQSALEEFAGRANMNLSQFNRMLGQNNIDPSTLRDFVQIGVAWRDYIRSRFSRQVRVTDADVDRALSGQGNSTSEIEVLLSEIIIPAPPPQAAQAQAVAERISQLRSFARFEAAAREVSALPSRDDGGRLGWLPITNYPPQIRSILLDLRPGEVTAPIGITNGVALFQMRGIREVVRRTPPPVSIDFAVYYIDGGRSSKGLTTAAQVASQIDTCDDLYGVARNQPAEVLDRKDRALSEISDDIALELARLDPGEVSYNLTRHNGETLVFLMLCSRTNAGQQGRDPDAVRNQIRGQRLTGLADALLEDLRASAVITGR